MKKDICQYTEDITVYAGWKAWDEQTAERMKVYEEEIRQFSVQLESKISFMKGP